MESFMPLSRVCFAKKFSKENRVVFLFLANDVSWLRVGFAMSLPGGLESEVKNAGSYASRKRWGVFFRTFQGTLGNTNAATA